MASRTVGPGSSPCLTDAQLQALIEGALGAAERAAMLAHVDGCRACRQVLAAAGEAAALEATAAPPSRDGEPVAPARGTKIGRYVVMELLGAGAMGEVHSAYDPDLDRRVALKILRGPDDGRGLSLRLLREAQSMARLSHPNVVPVHDAGTFGAQVFVAMELVEGLTLRAWLRQEPRGQREIVRVFLQAGRGLAAAHAAGIVHRDFKPDNVLCARDGRARVTDFGLARSIEGGTTGERGAASGSAGAEGVQASSLTQAGQIVGTPAYMAPEQVSGHATPASDQFSFCVALYEALYHERPFAGDSLAQLLESTQRGKVLPSAPTARVPVWLRRIVVRGLRARPEERWPSMADLLAALEHDPRRTLRRAGVALALVASFALAGAIALRADQRQRTLCKGAAAELAGVWGPDQRAAVRAAILSTGRPYAPSVADTVAARLDGYAGGWVAMETESCQATHVSGIQSEDLLDLRAACLRQEREDLRALVGLLALPAPDLADGALKAAYALAPLSRCEGAAALRSRTPPPRDAATAGRAQELRAPMARVRALLSAGRYESASAAALLVATAARAVAYLPLEAEALALLGAAQVQRRKLDDGVATYREAFEVAATGGSERSAAEALAGIVWASGVLQGRPAEAKVTAARAAELAGRLGDDKISAALAYAQGIFAVEDGDWDRAGASFSRARDLRARVFGADSLEVASVVDALGKVARGRGDLAAARSQHEQAMAMIRRVYGAWHPMLLASQGNLALVLFELGEYADALRLCVSTGLIESGVRGPESIEVAMAAAQAGAARAALGDLPGGAAMLERAVRMEEASLDPEHEELAFARRLFAGTLLDLGRPGEALAQAERSLASRRRSHPGDHDDVIESLLAVAGAQVALGRPGEALTAAAQARAMADRLHPTAHPALATARLSHCRVLVDAGRFTDAEAACAAARATAAEVFAPGHPVSAEALALAGEVELALGRPEAARALLEPAVAALEQRHGDVVARARARAVLARGALAAQRGRP